MLSLVSLFACLLSSYSTAPVFDKAVMQGSVKPAFIDDPSGLAASRTHPGLYYTHNDNGGRNRVFVVDPKTGDLKATLTISGVSNVDWESIAVGPCSASGGSTCIYIGDLGDSAGAAINNIYKVREPAEIRDQALPVLQRYHFTWSERQSECMMVDPASNVYIISLVTGGGLAAKLPNSGWDGRTVALTQLTPLAVYSGHHDPLGCDISPDGTEILLKGKVAVMYYRVVGGDVLKALGSRPEYLPYHQETLGEAIAWTPSGDGYYTLSQHHHAPFYFYRRQAPVSTLKPITNPPNTPQFAVGEMTSMLKAFKLDSVSGLAASRLHKGIFYLHNDKGGANRIFAVEPKTGVVQATYTIAGARNQDWEDIAVGVCPGSGTTASCIYIGDTGSSGGPASNTVYSVEEPSQLQDATLPLLDTLTFSWGERDCECLMVDPTGDTYVISRSTGGGRIARLPPSAWSGGTYSVSSTQKVALPSTHRDPLGCDLSANGSGLLLKGQTDVFYYPVTGEDVLAALQGAPARLPYTQEELGESIAWTASADGYYTVGQGHFLPFYFYKRL